MHTVNESKPTNAQIPNDQLDTPFLPTLGGNQRDPNQHLLLPAHIENDGASLPKKLRTVASGIIKLINTKD